MTKIAMPKEAEESPINPKKTRSKPGFHSLYVTLSDEHYNAVAKIAAEEDREIPAMLSRLIKLNFERLSSK